MNRRHFLLSTGATTAGIAGGSVYFMPPVAETGGSVEGTLCSASNQGQTGETLSIEMVQANETEVSVHYDLETDQSGVSTVIVADGEVLARQPWNSQAGDLAFQHEGPTRFDIEVRSADGDVLDSTAILAECGPAEEIA